MDAFDAVAIVTALAGLCMVLGGIWLVAKGVITLVATPKAEALTIEWKKQFRLNTQVPGLAFFVVGLLFMVTALLALKPPELVPIEFEGKVNGVDEPIVVLVSPSTPWVLQGSSDGIRAKLFPDVSALSLRIQAPGYEPAVRGVTVKSHKAQIEPIALRRSKVKEADLKPNVEPLPAGVQLPEVEGTGFGAPQS